MKEQTKSEAAIKNKSTLYFWICWCVIGMLIGMFLGASAIMMYASPVISVQNEVIVAQNEGIARLQEREDGTSRIIDNVVLQINELRNERDLRLYEALAESELQCIAVMRDDELRELILTEVEINFTAAQKEQLNDLALEIEEGKKEFEEERGYDLAISSATVTSKT